MLMILSKLYQGHKARKNRRLVGFCFSLHTKAASRGNLFLCQYICEIRRRLANRAAARFSWEDAKSPFVFATVKKTLYFLRPCHTLPDSANGRVTDNKILCPFVSVRMRFLSVPRAANAFRVR